MTTIENLIKSKEIRRLIVERSITCRVPLKYICKEIGIEYDYFLKAYINSKDADAFDISEEKFEKMLGLLGIKKRIQLVIDKSIDTDKISEDLENKYKFDFFRNKE